MLIRLNWFPTHASVSDNRIRIWGAREREGILLCRKMGDEVEKRKEDDSVGVVTKNNEEDDDCSLFPLFPVIPLAPSIRNPKPPRVTFVLEKASLVPAYVGRVRNLLLLPRFSLAKEFLFYFLPNFL